MVTPQAIPTGKVQALLELMELDGLPCGCVVAAFRARPWDLAVVSVEAKGPHCNHVEHAQGRLLELGNVQDLVGDTEEE